MTDIEQKALALVNEEAGYDYIHARDMANKSYEIEALCRAIEQHEAFRQEVSDAVEAVLDRYYVLNIEDMLSQFIIRKPDPLVKVLNEISHEGGFDNFNHYAHRLRAALDALGFEIREKNDD